MNFFWNQLLLGLVSKEIRQEEHEYMNIHSPFNAIVMPLLQVVVKRNSSRRTQVYEYTLPI